MANLEKNDMQGIIARGYSQFPAARYLLMNFKQADDARNYLQSIIGNITTADNSPDDYALQVALTSDGLRALELDPKVLATFSREFLEGMTEPHRQFVLGDQAANDPENWAWGGPKNETVHLLLMVFAKTGADLDQHCQQIQTNCTAAGISVIKSCDTNVLPGEKEHFGFRDGISQPIMEGFSKKAEDGRPFKAGEFVLGYENEYGICTPSPEVDPADDPNGLLPPHCIEAGKRDLGKNGTYLIFRQMPQDVAEFWKYLKAHSDEAGADQEEKAICLGAKMVGRWPGGAPLVKSPDNDNPAMSHENNFNYWQEDRKGTRCPFGSHIRRANPRDWLETEKKQDMAREMVRKHRILRRGRAYGPALAASMDAKDLMNATPDGQERGLHFICLVGHISRQFEFLQNAWIKSPVFAGLYKDGDPIIGTRNMPDGTPAEDFTVAAKPFRRKYTGMPQFTTVSGGAYFFLPGIKALRFITGA